MKTTIKSKFGHNVEVEHFVILHQRENNHYIKIEAKCGETQGSRKVTLGAVDGPVPSVSPEMIDMIVQQTLDEHRQVLADDVSWKEHIRLAVEKLK